MISNFLNPNSGIARGAALYVLAVIFTGSAIIAGFDYLHGYAVPPVISTVLGASLSFAVQTLGIHIAADIFQRVQDKTVSVQKETKTLTMPPAMGEEHHESTTTL